MVDNSPHFNKQTYVQGSNIPISTPIHTPEREENSHPSLGQVFEVTYYHIQRTQPITLQFVRPLNLLLVVVIPPHKLVRKETTPSGLLVSSVDYLVITTLEDLVDPTERKNQQGELTPVEENLGSEGEDFQFFYEERPDNNEDFNSEGEASSDSKEEEEEGE